MNISFAVDGIDRFIETLSDAVWERSMVSTCKRRSYAGDEGHRGRGH